MLPGSTRTDSSIVVSTLHIEGRGNCQPFRGRRAGASFPDMRFRVARPEAHGDLPAGPARRRSPTRKRQRPGIAAGPSRSSHARFYFLSAVTAGGRSLRALPGIAHEKSVFVKSAKHVWLPGGVDLVQAFDVRSIGAL